MATLRKCIDFVEAILLTDVRGVVNMKKCHTSAASQSNAFARNHARAPKTFSKKKKKEMSC